MSRNIALELRCVDILTVGWYGDIRCQEQTILLGRGEARRGPVLRQEKDIQVRPRAVHKGLARTQRVSDQPPRQLRPGLDGGPGHRRVFRTGVASHICGPGGSRDTPRRSGRRSPVISCRAAKKGVAMSAESPEWSRNSPEFDPGPAPAGMDDGQPARDQVAQAVGQVATASQVQSPEAARAERARFLGATAVEAAKEGQGSAARDRSRDRSRDRR